MAVQPALGELHSRQIAPWLDRMNLAGFFLAPFWQALGMVAVSTLTTYSSRPWGDIAVFSDTLMRHGCSIRRYAAEAPK